MKVSVVTAVLNNKKYIRKTIESILSQEGPFDVEYIIRDGLSTDGTLDIINEYKDRCVIVSEKDGSPQQAINAGMAMATGDIGCWLNADDVFLPGTIAKVVAAFERHSSTHWLYGRCDIIDESDHEIRGLVTLYKNITGYAYSWNWLLCENFINQPATFWRMDMWRQVGGLDESLRAAFDYQLWLKMGAISAALPIHDTLARFRRHSESISENHFVRQFQEELEICSTFGNGLHRLLHRLNYWKITAVYHLLAKRSLLKNAGATCE